jgi:hypothetical protein
MNSIHLKECLTVGKKNLYDHRTEEEEEEAGVSLIRLERF